jgi:hypothetical protein
MEHFSEQVFADLVRGIDLPVHAELRSHLASQCPQCLETFKMWNRMGAIATRESSYNAPTGTVRMVKLEFAARRMQEYEVPANLVFDSIAQPALAGVRSSGAAAARQMVYEAEGMMVDLRFDQQPGSKCISLIGQVLDRQGPRRSLAHAPVMLWTEKGLVITETKTNGFGEFHLEFEVQDRMRLSIQAFGGNVIRIPLASLCADQERSGITGGTRGGYR